VILDWAPQAYSPHPPLYMSSDRAEVGIQAWLLTETGFLSLLKSEIFSKAGFLDTSLVQGQYPKNRPF
jgi:hypothetical protein